MTPAGVIQAGVPRAAQPRRVFVVGATGTFGARDRARTGADG